MKIARMLVGPALAGLLTGAGPPPAAPQSEVVPSHIATFWRDGDPGERLEIRGRVLTQTFEPVAGAEVRVRQADGSGEYTAGYQGVLLTSDRGEYVLRTAMPGNYGVPRHIHIAAAHPDHGYRVTEIRFKGDPLLPEADRDEAIAVETVRLDGREHKVGTFDIVLGGS